MTARALSSEQEAQVVDEYLAGESSNVLAPKYGVSGGTICHILKRYGHKMRPSGSRWTGTDEQVAQVVALYQSGQSVETIALHMGTHQSVVSQTLRAQGVTLRHGMGRRIIQTDQYEGITDRYLDGETMSSIAKSFKVAVPTIANILDRQKVKRRMGGSIPFWTTERQEAACRLYLAGSTFVAIGKLWSVSPDSVRDYCRRAGIVSRGPRLSGDRHPGWKGGRHINKNGYVLVSDDERPYILEHRKVMAEHIGRPLKRSESVHHIDGDKQNNNISNLQLCFGKHGKGVALRCGACGSQNIISNPL